MKNKGFLITTITISSLFFISFITSFALTSGITWTKEWDSFTNYVGNEFSANDYLQVAKSNIHNVFDLSYFLFGYEGFAMMGRVQSSSFVAFNVFYNFLTPVFGILAVFVVGSLIAKIVSENIRRGFKLEIMEATGKLGTFISFAILVVFMLIGFSLISSLEPSFRSNGADFFGGKDSGFFKDANPDALSFVTMLEFSMNGKLGSLIGLNVHESLNPLIDSIKSTNLQAGLVFLVILTPITAIAFITFLVIWFGTFISEKHGGLSSFGNWIANVRIDSKREYFTALRRNVWLWIIGILFLAIMIFPGMVHKYETTQQIMLTVVSVLLIIICAIPLVFGFIAVKKMQAFNYNLLLWIQILTLWIVLTLFQLTVWVLFKDSIITVSFLTTIWPFSSIIASTIAAFGFIGFGPGRR